jgi:hypothetical protein
MVYWEMLPGSAWIQARHETEIEGGDDEQASRHKW